MVLTVEVGPGCCPHFYRWSNWGLKSLAQGYTDEEQQNLVQTPSLPSPHPGCFPSPHCFCDLWLTNKALEQFLDHRKCLKVFSDELMELWSHFIPSLLTPAPSAFLCGWHLHRVYSTWVFSSPWTLLGFMIPPITSSFFPLLPDKFP